MKEPAHTLSLWQGMVVSGPVILTLHLCMAVFFAAAVVVAFRRSGSVGAFACALAPFLFGTVAMWMGVRGHISMAPEFSSGLYDGDPRESLHLLQRPFFIGSGLSAVALVVYFFARAFRPEARHA
ncbi:MAG: hypothetical protein ABJF10_23910 [Chthoniobacter sp.]|uniref:hypothetical protein n=1 Tax=Chthoniobacter sp. TaxID=2510640 RepID=UPI0032A50778